MLTKNLNDNYDIYIYSDLMSQPCRALIAFLKLNNIKYIEQDVLISKGMNKELEYKRNINIFGTVPAMKIINKLNNKQLILRESVTIAKYLSDLLKTKEYWYNREDIDRRALIDQYLDWHHVNTRIFCAKTVQAEYIFPLLNKKFNKNLKGNSERNNLPKFFKFINEELKTHKYIIDNVISIADLFLYNEIIMLNLVNFDYSEYTYVVKYINELSKLKEIEECNKVLYKVLKNIEKKPKF